MTVRTIAVFLNALIPKLLQQPTKLQNWCVLQSRISLKYIVMVVIKHEYISSSEREENIVALCPKKLNYDSFSIVTII